jgi:5-methylcytosine-specific restriction endonuclease McrA
MENLMESKKVKEFIRLAFFEVKKFEEIVNELSISINEVRELYANLSPMRIQVADVKNIWNAKKPDMTFHLFYEWYIGLQRNCYYCGISETEINELIDNEIVSTKRTRGRKLELDRLSPNESYSNLDNIKLCCYWCNNAKTDTFNTDEFQRIGKVIGEIWKERKSKNVKQIE